MLLFGLHCTQHYGGAGAKSNIMVLLIYDTVEMKENEQQRKTFWELHAELDSVLLHALQPDLF